MNKYELMVIYNPNQGDAGVKAQTDSLKKKIDSFGGKVISEDFWGLKDLAYPMKGLTQAYYEVVTVEMPATKVADLSDFLNKQEEAVVRNMISVVE